MISTKPYQPMISRSIVLSIVALLGILSGLALTAPGSQVQAPLDGYSLLPPPSTLEELVDESDIIVIGTVGSITKEASFLGYDKHGKAIEPSPDKQGLAFFDHTIKIERILKNHQTKTLKVGQTIPFRMFDKSVNPAAESRLEYPPSVVGERRLYFLNTNPDERTYGLNFHTAARLIIDGVVVTRSDGQRTPVNYGNGEIKPNKFINDVKAIVKNKKQKGEK